MTVNIFTDCVDKKNAKKRQIRRYKSLFTKAKIKLKKLILDNNVPVLAGAIDLMDSVRFSRATHIFVFNIADRTEKQYENGAPFCFARLDSPIIIIGTPWSFYLLKKLGVLNEVHVTDVFEVCTKLIPAEAKRIAHSQFRSYDYVALLARWIFDEKEIPNKLFEIPTVTIEEQIWHVDCFGNCKTTIPNSFFKNMQNGHFVTTRFGKFKFYQGLKDVPSGEPAIIVGSSGFFVGVTNEDKRFAELVINGGSFADKYSVTVGNSIFN